MLVQAATLSGLSRHECTQVQSCRFDEVGLWAFRNAWFSAHGTLLSTAAALVDAAEAGYHADELTALLHVQTKAALAKLAGDGRLFRRVVDGRLLYLCADTATRRRQLSARQVHRAEPATLAWRRPRSVMVGTARSRPCWASTRTPWPVGAASY